jgi:DNA-directed RNA polymerase subunit RPC12/RpoP
MSEDEVSIAMSLPLDSEGFLRRECPTCEREFKWFTDEDDDSDGEPIPDGGYHCPYCGVQAPPDAWLTQAQVGLAENLVETQVLGPMLKRFAKDVDRLGRWSGGTVRATMKYDAVEELDPLTEADDMRRVDFNCHSTEPVKVLDDWAKPVRCLICGEFAA